MTDSRNSQSEVDLARIRCLRRGDSGAEISMCCSIVMRCIPSGCRPKLCSVRLVLLAE
jgi:hypothetical protein